MFTLAEPIHKVIQGEGELINWKMLLMRVSNCNVQCPNCFGYDENKSPLLISMFDGTKKELNQIQINDELLTFDNNGKKVKTIVTNVLIKSVSKYTKLDISHIWDNLFIPHTSFNVTEDHPFFTKEGLLEVRKLKIGNELINDSSNTFVVNEKKKIRKSLDVINITCNPYPSYIINGFHVHNCDSYHTWDKTRFSKDTFEITEQSLALHLTELFQTHKVNKLIISGGEPHLYQTQILELIKLLPDNIIFDIETTGMKNWDLLIPYFNRVHFDLSPKIGSLVPGINIKKYNIFTSEFLNKAWYNVKVVTNQFNFDKDINVIKDFQDKYNIPNNKIYLMPLGTTREEMIKESNFIIDKCFEYEYEFSPRLHILMFDNQRLV